MTNFERIHTAMKNKKADRVSVMCQLSHGYMERNSGVRPLDMYFNAESAAQAFMILRREYDFDGIILNMAFDSNWRSFYESIRTETLPDGERYHMPDGRIYELRGKGFAQTKYLDAVFPDIDELDPSCVDYRMDHTNRMELHKIIVEHGRAEHFSVHGEIGSPFDRFCFLLGLENAMVALITHGEKCHELLKNYVLECYAFAKAQIDVGVDTMKIASPFAGGSFISSRHYEEFVVPYEKAVVSLIHEYRPDMPVYIHTCGFIGDRLELMASTGIDGLECMDPPPLGNTLLADAKKRVGGKLFLKGNMDSVNVMYGATEEIMDAYVKKMIEDGAGEGGYILSSACSVAPVVNSSVLKSLVPLAEKYGRY